MLVHLLRSHPDICSHDEVFLFEEMITPSSEKLQSLLDLMGVSWQELTTTAEKLCNNDLRTAIANFDELRTHFAVSPYSKFFEDA